MPIKKADNSISPIPSATKTYGNLFGYFRYFTGGWKKSLAEESARLEKTVFSTNVGTPVIVCGDHKSAETLFKNVSNLTNKHAINAKCTRATKPIFLTKGQNAVNARRFIQSILPANTKDTKYQAGLSSLKKELQKWAELPPLQLKNMKVETAIADLIVNYTSHLLLDKSLDLDLIGKIFPIPNYLPRYPSIPKWLIPSYHRMPKILAKLFEQMKTSRRWPEISARAAEFGLSENQACEQLFTAITFNAAGLSNSLINGILLTALLPKQGQELIEDETLIDSFVWELLRHNGPAIMMKLADDTHITTSSGVNHVAKSGSTVMCSTAMAQRDASLWQDAAIFRADRFISTLSKNHSTIANNAANNSASNGTNNAASEPLPTLAFGCPIGHINDSNQKNHTHQCPFMELAHPLIKDFLQILIQNFQWQIDPSVLSHIKRLETENIMDVDFNLAKLRGGPGATVDMVPKIPGGIKFSSFSTH